MINPQ